MTASNINSVQEILSPVFGKHSDKVAFAYLFGSAAKEKMLPLSDVDIAVYFSHVRRELFTDSRLSLYADFCRALKRNDIDIIVLNTATNIIILDEIVRQGKVLYDRDPNLREEFELLILHQAIDFREQRLAVLGI